MTEILDELSVEIGKSQEAFHFFYLSGCLPFLDYFDFVSFHLDLSFFNNDSQYGYLLHVKVTFGSFET